MNPGNYQLKLNERQDTGLKWFDPSGVAYNVYRSMFFVGGLPNSTTKNILHNKEIDTTRFARVVGFWARNAGSELVQVSVPATLDIQLTSTQLRLVSSADLSAFTDAYVIVEYCMEDDES